MTLPPNKSIPANVNQHNVNTTLLPCEDAISAQTWERINENVNLDKPRRRCVGHGQFCRELISSEYNFAPVWSSEIQE